MATSGQANKPVKPLNEPRHFYRKLSHDLDKESTTLSQENMGSARQQDRYWSVHIEGLAHFQQFLSTKGNSPLLENHIATLFRQTLQIAIRASYAALVRWLSPLSESEILDGVQGWEMDDGTQINRHEGAIRILF